MPRRQKTIHYIYKTTCLVTGRYYIGMHSTSNLEDGYMGSGKRLRYSIRKYGVDNHKKEVIEFCKTRELLIEAEMKIITPEMITDKNCMNLKLGGTGGFANKEHRINFIKAAKKTRHLGNEKLKELYKDEKWFKDWCKKTKNGQINNGYKHQGFLDKNHSEETKKLMSKIKKGTGVGKSNSQYGTYWITKDGENKKIKKEDLDNYMNKGWVKGRK